MMLVPCCVLTKPSLLLFTVASCLQDQEMLVSDLYLGSSPASVCLYLGTLQIELTETSLCNLYHAAYYPESAWLTWNERWTYK